MHTYSSEYATRYIETTLHSPYTVYKNGILAEMLANLSVENIFDFGGNISGLIRMPGSLRFKLEKFGVTYSGIDLVPEYFSHSFAKSLGVPDEELYPSVGGIVGNLLHLPLADNSVDGAVCADVIEHIENPDLALSEMCRVLKPGGKVIVVVPSLYKLDAIKLPHVTHRRYSSHANRLLISEWIQLIIDAGFTIDSNLSRPIGIASGLLYLAWLNPDYIPIRPDASSIDVLSANAKAFHRIKNKISKVDELIDKLLLDDESQLELVRSLFQDGDVHGILRQIYSWYSQVTHMHDPDLEHFVATFDAGLSSPEGLRQLQAMILSNNEIIQDNAFFGNSALLVLTKK